MAAEHPAREDDSERDGTAHPRVHRVHQVREGRQGGLTDEGHGWPSVEAGMVPQVSCSLDRPRGHSTAAIASISTHATAASLPICTVARAGGTSGKYFR